MTTLTHEDSQWLSDKGAELDDVNQFLINEGDDAIADLHDRIQHEMDCEMDRAVDPEFQWESDTDDILATFE